MRGIISILLSGAILLAASASSLSQSTAGPSSPNKSKDPEPDIKVSSRLVVVDVVVRKGSRPLSGLQQGDFTLDEDGAQQTIRYFTPHFADQTELANTPAAPPRTLPPNTYTNLPAANVTDSVTVLLLDGLNTEPSDVLYVRREVISYLKKMPPGQRIAVFALGHTLRMLKGFTTDTGQLLEVLEKANATSPTSLLPPEAQKFEEAEALDMARTAGVSPQDIANINNFMGEDDTRQTAMRVSMTLAAMQQLSRYLTGIDGRKNLVWFSGAFPVQFFSFVDIVFNGKNGGQAQSVLLPTETFDQELRETADMLAAARVAVYPVDARGVLMEPMFASTQMTGNLPSAGGPQGGTFKSDQQLSGPQMAAEHSTMDALAQQTGGRAVHDSNGLQEAMADAFNDGSNYYTLAYVPTNENFNGAQRNIQVRLAHEKADLFYRRSYYADAAMLSGNGAKWDGRAVFLDAMQRGVPASSQIVFDVRVAAPDQNPPSGPVVGTNSAMKNRAARYAIDYAANLGTVGLTQSASGTWQGHVAALVIAYDQDGNRLNWAVNDLPFNLDQASRDRAAHSGLQIHQVLDLPAGDVFLRVGLYDPTSGHFGTFEVSLHVPATK
jgi:VWFA-related protein